MRLGQVLIGVKSIDLLKRFHWERVFFLFHDYRKNENKGMSPCNFAVGPLSSYLQKKHLENPEKSPSGRLLYDDYNLTEITDILKTVKSKARGK